MKSLNLQNYSLVMESRSVAAWASGEGKLAAKGQEGTFGGDGNILYLDHGGG